jgi:hypothetical protein
MPDRQLAMVLAVVASGYLVRVLVRVASAACDPCQDYYLGWPCLSDCRGISTCAR